MKLKDIVPLLLARKRREVLVEFGEEGNRSSIRFVAYFKRRETMLEGLARNGIVDGIQVHERLGPEITSVTGIVKTEAAGWQVRLSPNGEIHLTHDTYTADMAGSCGFGNPEYVANQNLIVKNFMLDQTSGLPYVMSDGQIEYLAPFQISGNFRAVFFMAERRQSSSKIVSPPNLMQNSQVFLSNKPNMYFLYNLEQSARNSGGWKKRPRESQPEASEITKVAVATMDYGVGQLQLQFGMPLPQEPILGFNAWAGPAGNDFAVMMQSANGSSAGKRDIKNYRLAAGKANETGTKNRTEKEADGDQPSWQDKPPGEKRREPVPLSALKDFKAAIFDLDGVLVDSENAHLETFRQAFAKFRIDVSPSYWKRNYTGIGSRAIVEDVFRKNGIREAVPNMVSKRAGIYQRYIEKNGLPAIPGALKAIELIRESGARAIVASGGQRSHISASLRSIGVSGMPFVGHEDVKNHKPSPDTFLLAAEKAGARPSECIVFEDSLSGIKAAASAGMVCVALSTTLPQSELRGRAAMVAKDFNSPKLRKLLSRLAAKRKGKDRKKLEASDDPVPVPSKKRRGKKLRRPVLIRLG